MAEDAGPGYSIVQYMGDHTGSRCGYCKSKDTNYSHGMWAHQMSVQDYQDLIDRGWRRSGKYCYKPTMNKTCCPSYTIKCDSLNFQLSKSQKKVLKRMQTYLSYGKCPKSGFTFEGDIGGTHEADLIQRKHNINKDFSELMPLSGERNQQQGDATEVEFGVSSKKHCSKNVQNEKGSSHKGEIPVSVGSPATRKMARPGMGQDLSKPPCKKAKLLRKERRAAKLTSLNPEDGVQQKNITLKGGSTNQPKSLEEYLALPKLDYPAHRLEFRLVPVNSRESKFSSTFQILAKVFRDYQMAIHHDPPDECDQSSFKNFLVDGPLTPWKPTHGPPMGYGPFHQQYWLDGQLIAVGVIDILPHSISSVYLYYDPKFSFLSLGTYSSVREIALTRELHRSSPDLRWYYMGFYIHSCPKMRYKGNYLPSFLLCPETYSWLPIQNCASKLDVKKYSRFSDDSQPGEEAADISKVQCFSNGFIIRYRELQTITAREDDEDEVKEYLSLVGAKVADSLILLRD